MVVQPKIASVPTKAIQGNKSEEPPLWLSFGSKKDRKKYIQSISSAESVLVSFFGPKFSDLLTGEVKDELIFAILGQLAGVLKRYYILSKDKQFFREKMMGKWNQNEVKSLPQVSCWLTSILQNGLLTSEKEIGKKAADEAISKARTQEDGQRKDVVPSSDVDDCQLDEYFDKYYGKAK
jgi:hypothetical protein